MMKKLLLVLLLVGGGSTFAEEMEVRARLPEPIPPAPSATLPVLTEPMEEALLSARVDGVVAQICVELGEQVKQGDLLAKIAAPELQAQEQRAKAGLQQREARVVLAETEFRRVTDLLKTAAVSRSAYDVQQAGVAGAKAERDEAKSELDRMAALVSYLEVHAPFDGVVVERYTDRGHTITTGTGAERRLMRIAQLNSLRVVADVPQTMLPLLPVGSEHRLRFAGIAGEPFVSQVSRRSMRLEPTTGTMRIELLLPNPDLRLPAGLAGQLLVGDSPSPGVRIPSQALIQRDGKPFVATVDPTRHVRFVAVEKGRAFGDSVEITHGISLSDNVILSPNALLQEGDTVRLVADNTK